MTHKKNWLKFVIGWAVVFAVRLFPFRPPNFEPVLAVLMPFSKHYKYGGAFSFGFLSIALFDLAVGQLGTWTLITGLTYGIVGLGASWYLGRRPASAFNFATYGVIGTLIYDGITGLTVGPLLFGQPFMEALIGQIPFTLYHLAGTVIFSLLVSSAVYRWVVVNEKLESGAVLSRLFKASRV